MSDTRDLQAAPTLSEDELGLVHGGIVTVVVAPLVTNVRPPGEAGLLDVSLSATVSQAGPPAMLDIGPAWNGTVTPGHHLPDRAPDDSAPLRVDDLDESAPAEEEVRLDDDEMVTGQDVVPEAPLPSNASNALDDVTVVPDELLADAPLPDAPLPDAPPPTPVEVPPVEIPTTETEPLPTDAPAPAPEPPPDDADAQDRAADTEAQARQQAEYAAEVDRVNAEQLAADQARMQADQMARDAANRAATEEASRRAYEHSQEVNRQAQEQIARLDADMRQQQIARDQALMNVITGSPLVLDLEGDGIEVLSLEDSHARFDMDLDGAPDATGWVGPRDGFVVLDRNDNGVIDSRAEMFGDLEGATNGFEHLSHLDTNADGILDRGDAAYEKLSVWTDRDGDGKTDGGEVVTLREAGVASIRLDAVEVNEAVGSQWISHRSVFEREDGSSARVDDVWFQYAPSGAER